jgi:hypothetical protein
MIGDMITERIIRYEGYPHAHVIAQQTGNRPGDSAKVCSV